MFIERLTLNWYKPIYGRQGRTFRSSGAIEFIMPSVL